MSHTSSFLLFAALSAAAPAQSGAAPAGIRWHVPGEFERAVAAAKDQKRLIMIKGIAFGIDKTGARNATKGKW